VPEVNSFCGTCGTAVDHDVSSAPTQTSIPESSSTPHPGTTGVTRTGASVASARTVSSTTIESRFLPGQIFAGRYRIVGLLGWGGMGEIYRADDIKLGQPVALKFLPEALEQNRSRLDRFLHEVRIARQVSHDNVCRVYDVGEVEGQHYLSMEYVDGEDLASLLRRIGRLPGDKALQIARQMCAGLAAAHKNGVIHRDLKPANLMIDGRGQVRITDFGLAGLAEEFQGAEIRVGTPSYMAPEQLAGEEVTVKSDLYSLGLVLYEMFTGKPAFADRNRERTTMTPISTVVSDVDPVVERVIEHCLERNPERRPASALAVAAALPGGDPLAAALAAGETPSPEMIAAAGPEGGLKPGTAVLGLVLVVFGVLANATLLSKSTLYGRAATGRQIAALEDQSRTVIRDLGYTTPAKDGDCSFNAHLPALQYFAEQDSSASRWEPLSKPGEIGIYFFYRQSPNFLVPDNLGAKVNFVDPYPAPGDIIISMGLEGRVLRFLATPAFVDYDTGPAPPVDWSVMFEAAGLDMADFEPIPPTIQPLSFADTRAAWKGTLPHRNNIPVRFEAAALRGKPIFFETVTPYDPYWSPDTQASRQLPNWVDNWATSFFVILVGLAVGAIFLALHNWRQGRGDVRGATRLALYVLALRMLYWMFTAHHVPALQPEAYLLVIALGNASLLALGCWLLYIALEPYARRLWPSALVSWSRLLAGRFRDPLIGRDVLIGFAFGLGLMALINAFVLLPGRIGLPPPPPLLYGIDALGGSRWAFGQIFEIQLHSLAIPLGHFLALLILRMLLRKQWLAGVVYCAVIGLASAVEPVLLGVDEATIGLLVYAGGFGVLFASILLVQLVRFGLLTTAASFLIMHILSHYPITLDAGEPYFATSVMALVLAAGVAVYGFYVSLAGRPLFQDALLQE
jgi:serine/threonine-protein kinase